MNSVKKYLDKITEFKYCKKIALMLLGLFVLLNCLDGVFTYFGLFLGLVTEKNPIMVFAFMYLGIEIATIGKMLIISLLPYFTLKSFIKDKDIGQIKRYCFVVTALCTIYLIVIIKCCWIIRYIFQYYLG